MNVQRTIELRQVFGHAFEALTVAEKRLLHADVDDIYHTEHATDFLEAAATARERIGGLDNLRSYVDCLVAGERRKAGK